MRSSRRAFLTGSILAASHLGVGESFARGQRTAKRPLTPEAFTAYLAVPEKRRDIKVDLVRFVDTHFALSPGQLENFKRVPREDIRNFNEAIERAEKLNLRIVLLTTMTPLSCGNGLGFRMKTEFDSRGLTITSYQ